MWCLRQAFRNWAVNHGTSFKGRLNRKDISTSQTLRKKTPPTHTHNHTHLHTHTRSDDLVTADRTRLDSFLVLGRPTRWPYLQVCQTEVEGKTIGLVLLKPIY